MIVTKTTETISDTVVNKNPKKSETYKYSVFTVCAMLLVLLTYRINKRSKKKFSKFAKEKNN